MIRRRGGPRELAETRPGSRISLDALCDGRQLQISVSDNGPGGAKDGPGLTGLEDRVHACSGTLGIESPPGIGTTLTAVLPCWVGPAGWELARSVFGVAISDAATA